MSIIDPDPAAVLDKQDPKQYRWEHVVDGTKYIISNDKSKLDLGLFNTAFASDSVYWTGPMPEDAVRLMVENSCVLGLYVEEHIQLEANKNIKHSARSMNVHIGFARLITDYSTVAYITDVWIAPAHQGKSLGKWMVACMKEIIHSFPSLRRAVLLTQNGGKGVQFYERELGMQMADPEIDKYGFMQYVPQAKE